MRDALPVEPELQPDNERSALVQRLDQYRAIALASLVDLSWDDASARRLPSTDMTVAGIVKHLAWAEDRWFQGRLVGAQMPPPWDQPSADDPDQSMRLVGADTVASIAELYAAACERSRRTVAECTSLSKLAVVPSFGVGPVNLRWILVHMIDETARHAGHLDVLRDTPANTTLTTAPIDSRDPRRPLENGASGAPSIPRAEAVLKVLRRQTRVPTRVHIWEGQHVTAGEIRDDFDRDGFAILPAFLGPEEIRDAVADLPSAFPTPEQFHSDANPDRHRRFRDEFGGITLFPSESTALNLLSVHPRLAGLAAALLDHGDLRSYSIEFWAKYSGAADYDQPFHRDYLNHSVLVPSADAPPSQVEMFVYLSDVTDDLGPIALLPRQRVPDPPALPNWYPASSGQLDEEHPSWVSPHGHPDWYENEVKATGPAGTVVAYRIDTFHRGTNLVGHGWSRFTIHTNFRKASDDWITRRAWTDQANRGSDWSHFVASAAPEQLRLFGFPPPGHYYWTDATLAGVADRYPGFDPELWR